MTIQNIQPTITPTQLYQKFIKGERPEYNHDIESDKPMKELEALATKYKQTLSLDDKKKLLIHERDILYEELEHPELTVARNYELVADTIKPEYKNEDVNDIITIFNLTGIRRLESLSKPIIPPYKPDNKNKIKAINNSINNEGEFKKDVKKYSEEIIDILENRETTTKNKTISYSKTRDLNNLDDIKDLFLNADKSEYLKTTQLVNKMLMNGTPEEKLLATWGAGKFRSDENFNIIKKIALNKNEKDIKLREFAIHSTALYLKEKPKEVKSIMSKIKKDGTIFAPLAEIINKKINGKYQGVKNRELQKLSKEDRKFYRILKDMYVESDETVNTHKNNAIDRDLLFFKNNLSLFILLGERLFLTNDTVSKLSPELTGKRNIAHQLGIFNSGDYLDALEGGATKGLIEFSTNKIDNKTKYAGIGHELGHTLNYRFRLEDLEEQNRLYIKAQNEGRILDNYAGRNKQEYFAQGCEAMISIYKPHAELISGNYKNTRYDLMVKDPDLYKFIEKTMKIYC